jgi:hypothetical protein
MRVESEFERIDTYPGLPQRKFKYGSKVIDFDDTQYRDYCLYYGELVMQNAGRLIDTPQYMRLPNEKQSDAVDSFLSKMRSAARAKVIRAHRLL